MPIFTTTFLIGLLISIAISVALNVALMLLFPKQQPQQQQRQQNEPAAPNGQFNETQPIPPLRVIFGRVKTGGDVAFLEEKAGVAYQIVVHAAHRIEGYVSHWFHDELLTVDATSKLVTGPTHFASKPKIESQLGLDAETAWAAAVATFGSIWTTAHRGDGLSKVMLTVGAVDSQSFSNVYPQGFPSHTALIDGAWVYDPRTNQDPNDKATWSFSRNLAFGRLLHLTHPSGCRLRLSDLYLPDWIVAANVCDELVVNRDAVEEPRYWGGLSWKYRGTGQDPVSIGRKFDEAAELVVYQRGDGLVGVHAGPMGVPDIRLTSFLSLSYDANQSLASTVIAVRGRFTDPRNQWNPGDAAIFGEAYAGSDDTQRTRTVDDEAVQSHNHMQRLQKRAFIRANAPRVSATVQYDDAIADVMFRRFVTVHYPSRGLEEATVEIVGSTRLSLKDLTISFDAIVVPADFDDFDAATEEGIPGGVVGLLAATGVPTPTGFAVVWLSDSAGYYGRATVAHADDNFLLEVMYQIDTATEPPRTAVGNPGEVVLRTPPLPNVLHRFRARFWSAGAPSPWTAWLNPGTSAGDTTPTANPSGLTASYSGLNDRINGFWTNPSTVTLHHVELYRGDTTTFADAVLIATDYSAPSAVPTFSDPEVGRTAGSYWVIAYNGSGVASARVGPTTVT